MHERWKNAVVHFECARDGEDMDEWVRLYGEWRASGRSSPPAESPVSRTERIAGTGLLVEFRGRTYVVTALHVLEDDKASFRHDANEASGIVAGTVRVPGLAPIADQSGLHRVIFSASRFSETTQRKAPCLSNIGAGEHAYTALREHDLAVVSLNQIHTVLFAEGLAQLGRRPVPSSFIAQGPSEEGAPLFTVGFPSVTAIIDSKSASEEDVWCSTMLSLPVFTFGRVACLHADLEEFYADMTVYAGNSGGPVVEANKLVGIVIRQPTIQLEESELKHRIPFCIAVKSGQVLNLLEQQFEKDTRSPLRCAAPRF